MPIDVFLRILWRHKAAFVCTTLLVAMIAAGASSVVTPVYQSEAMLLVSEPRAQQFRYAEELR